MNTSNFCAGDFKGVINVKGDFTVIIKDNGVETVIDDPKAIKAVQKSKSLRFRNVSWEAFLRAYVFNCHISMAAVAKAAGISSATAWGRWRMMREWNWDIPSIVDTPPPPPMTRAAADGLIRTLIREKNRSSR
jgi:hypothetical protein